MQLMGPTVVHYLPQIPPGYEHPEAGWWVADITDLPIMGHAGDRWGLVELMAPVDVEWIELAVRLGRALTSDDLAVTARVETAQATDDPGWHRLVRECRDWCVHRLPPNQTYAVDGMGILGRVWCVAWE